MTIRRLTKDEIRNTVGVLNPIGHVILAFQQQRKPFGHCTRPVSAKLTYWSTPRPRRHRGCASGSTRPARPRSSAMS